MHRQTPALALTPPMGWNTWLGFGKNIHEDLIREMADAMISSGMKAVGYEYLVIDDLWHGGRDAKGFLYPDAQKFPGGMKALADDLHARGLKFGIYSDAGPKTCAGAPGSMGYEEPDAATFAAWGVDFLKHDYCYAPEDQHSAIQLYTNMSRALVATRRPVVYSICEWGEREPWLWGASAGGHMWRTSHDLFDLWDTPINSNTGNGVLMNLEITAGLADYAGPGHWNDPDLLVVGLYGAGHGAIGGAGLTDTEYLSHMSLWCMLAAPLMASCDLRKMNQVTRDILTNPEVIAIDQDPLGKQGRRVVKDGDLEVWKKPLKNDELAVALFNRGAQSARITAQWSDLGISGPCKVRDLWARQDLGTCIGRIDSHVPSHGITLFRLIPLR